MTCPGSQSQPVSGHDQDLSLESDSVTARLREGGSPSRAHCAKAAKLSPQPARPEWRLWPPSCSWRWPPHRGTGADPGGRLPPRTSDSSLPPTRRPLPPCAVGSAPPGALTIAAAAAGPAPAPLSPSCRGATHPGGSGGAGPRPRGRGARLPRARTRANEKRKLQASGPASPGSPAPGTGRLCLSSPGLVLRSAPPHVGGPSEVGSGDRHRPQQATVPVPRRWRCARDDADRQPGGVSATSGNACHRYPKTDSARKFWNERKFIHNQHCECTTYH